MGRYVNIDSLLNKATWLENPTHVGRTYYEAILVQDINKLLKEEAVYITKCKNCIYYHADDENKEFDGYCDLRDGEVNEYEYCSIGGEKNGLCNC